jgi:hypothetical protein
MRGIHIHTFRFRFDKKLSHDTLEQLATKNLNSVGCISKEYNLHHVLQEYYTDAELEVLPNYHVRS